MWLARLKFAWGCEWCLDCRKRRGKRSWRHAGLWARGLLELELELALALPELAPWRLALRRPVLRRLALWRLVLWTLALWGRGLRGLRLRHRGRGSLRI